MSTYYYFKLFNNIKSDHEAEEFAKLELNGLFGDVKPIKNFHDVLVKNPLKMFTKKPTRIQDIITHELPYGKIQGYYIKKSDIENITKLIKRLGYTREIFVVVEKKDSINKTLKKLFADGVLGRNVQYFEEKDHILFRFITNQYFLEKSQYISKLSRNEEEVKRNVQTLTSHLIKKVNWIPASSTLSIGKRLEDYFAIREEPSLYLNHYIHPYKGKFHPKMVRALLNYVYPKSEGVVLDNFAGSGTLLLEASHIELDSRGVEINPLSVLMSNVKCNSLKIEPKELKKNIDEYLVELKRKIKIFETNVRGQETLGNNGIEFEEVEKEAEELYKDVTDFAKFRNSVDVVKKIIIARELIKKMKEGPIKEFFLLALSGSISDVARRTKNEFYSVFEDRLNDIYLRLFLFHELNDLLKIKPGASETHCTDTRAMDVINPGQINGIVNSPPYSTALDYIKNDYPQLRMLKLVDSKEDLEQNMMGNPRINYDKEELLEMIEDEEKDPLKISKLAHKYVELLLNNGRKNAALRVYKFFIDMFYSFKEMKRVMKKGSKAAVIIGNNHFKVNGDFVEIPNSKVLADIGKNLGFKQDKLIRRELQKTSYGNIKKESVLIFEK